MYPLHVSIDSFLRWLPTLPLGLGSMWPWGSAQQLMSSQTMHSGLDFPISSWWDSMHSLFLWTWSLGSLHTVYVFILTHKHTPIQRTAKYVSVFTLAVTVLFYFTHSLLCILVAWWGQSSCHSSGMLFPASFPLRWLQYCGTVGWSIVSCILYCTVSAKCNILWVWGANLSGFKDWKLQPRCHFLQVYLTFMWLPCNA